MSARAWRPAVILMVAACGKTGSELTGPATALSAATPTPSAASTAAAAAPSESPVSPRVVWCARVGETGRIHLAGSVASGEVTLVAGTYGNEAAQIGGAKWPAPRSSGGFFARLDDGGGVRWARRTGGQGDTVDALAAAPAGGFAIAGRFLDELDLVDFGGKKLTTPSRQGAFALNLDPEGKVRWSALFDGRETSATAARFDATGRLVVAGEFSGAVEFGKTRLKSDNLVAHDAYVVQLDTSGHVGWAKRFGNKHGVRLGTIAVNSDGSTLAVGEFSDTITFGTSRLETGDVNVSATFLVKLDSGGNVVWARSLGTKTDVHGMAVGPQGDIFLAGGFAGRLNLGQELVSAGDRDAFVARLSAAGEPIWSARFGAEEDDYATALAVDSAGEATFAGVFAGPVTFGTERLVGVSRQGSGRHDTFAAKIGADGAPRWALHFGPGVGSEHDGRLVSVALDSSGDPIVAGEFDAYPPFRFPCGREAVVAHSYTTAFVAKLRK